MVTGPLTVSVVRESHQRGAIMLDRRRVRPLSEALAMMPGLCHRLLVEHVPDPSGHRCRACTTPGTGTPGAAWPCRIRDAAEAAQSLTRPA